MYSPDDHWKRDAEMVRALGAALRIATVDSESGRAAMEWSAGSFGAKVVIEINSNGETMEFQGPLELEEYLAAHQREEEA